MPRRLRVLAAEDVPTNQLLLQHLLARDGHHYEIANNGREALEAVRNKLYDVILMDAQMLEMDGIEATRRIRQLPLPQGGVPIIMVTANAMIGDSEKYMSAGATDYLSKPIKAAALRDARARAEARPLAAIGTADLVPCGHTTIASMRAMKVERK